MKLTKKSAIQTTASINRDCIIQCAKVGATDGECAVLFKITPIDARINAWPEKILNDAVYQKEEWTQEMGFEDRPLAWCHNGVDMKNTKNYSVRLFCIQVEEFPDDETLYEVAASVCDQLNAAPGNTTMTNVNKDNFFWVQGVTTWQNVISVSDCLKRLIRLYGSPQPGWFEQNTSKVKSYFAPGTINEALARRIFAPNSMVHGFEDGTKVPTKNEATEEEDDDETKKPAAKRDVGSVEKQEDVNDPNAVGGRMPDGSYAPSFHPSAKKSSNDEKEDEADYVLGEDSDEELMLD